MSTLRIDREGSGPPLVLVHSLLTDARAFDLVAPRLSSRFALHRVWLPGFGGSEPLADRSSTLFDVAESVRRSLQEAGVTGDGVAVLGNGFGSFVCVALAAAHGHLFGPLIVANGGAAFSPERRAAFTTMSDLVSDSGMGAVVEVAVRRIFTGEYLEAHPTAVEERRAVLLEIDPGSFAASCRALRDMDLRPHLGAIDNPTLVISGAADTTTPPEMGDELAASLCDAEFVVLEHCGHCPPLERPTAFCDAVEDYLVRKLTA
ncbi:MAG: alpha/beta fold hydrolase [bacterium]|nr:alpha/beta fold hydrolase [bacterium]